ncbi:MAG TPA: serine/threonine-protein kinase [Vicinamibacterales bacterium]|nr:serine/threonine-protein kinase [Vicinamibacterales bacterium]
MSILSADRWRALSPYLDRALDLTDEEREPWLDTVRRDDPALAADLQSLLAERDAIHDSGFLEGPAVMVDPAVSLAGLRVGAYTLVSPIGRGGMGTVWLAERSDGLFTRKAAVKLLNAALMGRGGEERFKQEGTLLARLTHPHIAHLLDAGVTGTGQPYLVLELVDGQHIDRYCHAHALGVEARLRLFLDVLEAVAHAHANLIVHRDLKPSNVLVREDGVVKLLDFGIAKLLDHEHDAPAVALTVDGGRALTPEYAAPEQLTGGPITTATDVHALGVLLYVLLGGPNPAAGTSGSAAELIKVIVETDAPRLSDVAPNGKSLRGDLDNIVAKALKKRPEERYPSVTAFADDLRRYLNREPVSARADTLVYRTTKFVQRRSGAVATAAAVVLLVGSLIGIYTARLAAERDRARLEADKSAKMSELLTSLLTGADPYPTRDREPTVRNILDAGAERVQNELGGQPELKAEMLTVIGRVYARLGLYDKAKPLLSEALALGRRDPADTPRLAQTLNDLGVLSREQRDTDGARALLEESLAMRRRLFGDVHKDVAVTLVELGRVYVDRGLGDRAEPLYRESLDIRRKVFGEVHRETAVSKSSLGLVLLNRGDLAAAEPLLREVLDTTRKVLPADHPNVAASWNSIGLLLLEKGDFAGAEPMIRQSLAIRRKQFGDRHVGNVPSLHNLSVSLREQGRLDEAAAVLNDAIAFTRESLGDDNPGLGRLHFQLGRVHLARKDWTTAEHLLRDALTRQQRTLPADDWRTAATRSALGAALTPLGRYDEAARLLEEAARVLKDVPGRQGREAAAARARLAALDRARAAGR